MTDSPNFFRDSIMVCDECMAEFPFRAVEIKEQDVEGPNGILEVSYFLCPSCFSPYIITIKDSKFHELLADLEAMKKRIKRGNGKRNKLVLQKLIDMADKKLDRLRRYSASVKAKYDGQFMSVMLKDGSKELRLKTMLNMEGNGD